MSFGFMNAKISKTNTEIPQPGTRFRINTFLDSYTDNYICEPETRPIPGSYSQFPIKNKEVIYKERYSGTKYEGMKANNSSLNELNQIDDSRTKLEVNNAKNRFANAYPLNLQDTIHSNGVRRSDSKLDPSVYNDTYTYSDPNISKPAELQNEISSNKNKIYNSAQYRYDKPKIYANNVENSLKSAYLDEYIRRKEFYKENRINNATKSSNQSISSINSVKLPSGLLEDEEVLKINPFMNHNVRVFDESASKTFSKFFKESDTEKDLYEKSDLFFEETKVDISRGGLTSFMNYGSKAIDDINSVSNLSNLKITESAYPNKTYKVTHEGYKDYTNSTQGSGLDLRNSTNKNPNRLDIYADMYYNRLNNSDSVIFNPMAKLINAENSFASKEKIPFVFGYNGTGSEYKCYDSPSFQSMKYGRNLSSQLIRNEINHEDEYLSPNPFQNTTNASSNINTVEGFSRKDINSYNLYAGIVHRPSENAFLSPTNIKLKHKSEIDANLYANASVKDFSGQISTLSKDQYGCRFLQKKIAQGNLDDMNLIFKEILPNFEDLMKDSFGNYLCQKFFEYCTNDQQNMVIDRISDKFVEIALNMHGTRAAQKLVEYLPRSDKEHIEKIKTSVKDSVILLIKDLNGNHVIQKFLANFQSQEIQFIYDSVARHCVETATHRHGCCVFQRCIDRASKHQLEQLVDQIIKNALSLVKDPFGNYVVQYVLDLNKQDFNERVISQFVDSVCELSMQKFSSNVIEKCIRISKKEIRGKLIDTILYPHKLNLLIRDSYGNYVVQTILDHIDPKKKPELISILRPLLSSIRQTPHGKRIFSKIYREGTSNMSLLEKEQFGLNSEMSNDSVNSSAEYAKLSTENFQVNHSKQFTNTKGFEYQNSNFSNYSDADRSYGRAEIQNISSERILRKQSFSNIALPERNFFVQVKASEDTVPNENKVKEETRSNINDKMNTRIFQYQNK
ncbi:hypothetical protein BB560_002602 [Smittium megazygosporum]|uniref:PUM-HD domain-containing protein n=1 Tax=Smittium megazygosporum TaxID=133381 RepID=A0A2T9ZE94_9FUNG|nr:hypothetical protein BB560_002602 [Smittium megazygosporum]